MIQMVEGIKIPIYEFNLSVDSDTDYFKSVCPPTKMYLNEIEAIWKSYDKYPEMSMGSGTNYNENVLEQLKQKGVITVDIHKRVFDNKINKLMEIQPLRPETIFGYKNQEDLERIRNFYSQKLANPYIGIFWGISENEHTENDFVICELDWLPIPNRKMEFSANIFHYNDIAWLVLFHHDPETKTIRYLQELAIGNSGCFYDENEDFAPQRLLELEEILPSKKIMNVIEGWNFFFINRHKYFFGVDPYKECTLEFEDEIETIKFENLNNQEKIRLFLIWLNRLQEFVEKIHELHKKGQTIVMTNNHNEMNGEYVSYNTTYTPEIRQEIIQKKDQFKLYAIANDWFINFR